MVTLNVSGLKVANIKESPLKEVLELSVSESESTPINNTVIGSVIAKELLVSVAMAS